MTKLRTIQASSYIREDLYALVQQAAHLQGISLSRYVSVASVKQARKELENEKKGIHRNE